MLIEDDDDHDHDDDDDDVLKNFHVHWHLLGQGAVSSIAGT